MSDVTIVQPVAETPASEAIIEAVAENVTDTTSDNDVAIAAIEASARVEVAAIEAEADVARMEAITEAEVAASENREDASWRISHLEAQVAEVKGMVETLVTAAASPASLIPVVTEAEIVTEAETLPETTLIPISTAEETSSTPMEHSEKSGEGEPVVVIPPLVEVGRKPIIKLV